MSLKSTISAKSQSVRIGSFAILLLLICACNGGRSGSGAAFPAERGGLQYASNLAIVHEDGYTAVTLRDPWDSTRVRRSYLLVDRDKALPDNLPEGTVIRVPVQRAVIYTTVHAAMADQLGCLDHVVGICDKQYITSEAVLSRISDGRIADLGPSTAPDIEKIIDLGADVIIASPFENSGYGAAEKTGVPIVEAADYMEDHPLGRSEWLRFYGLLFGRNEEAMAAFKATEERYNHLKALAATAAERPTVLLEKKYGPSWPVPSGDCYIGVIHRDAGADYIFADISGRGNVAQLSYETVYDKAADCDLWLFKYNAASDYTYASLRLEYEPYANFTAWRDRKIYACNSAYCSYYDDITFHPDWLLEDLIHIYHPELLPDYEPRYYKPLR